MSQQQQQQQQQQHQHGVKGVYYGGEWLDIEDLDGKFLVDSKSCSGCEYQVPCPRSQSRNVAAKSVHDKKINVYDICIIGAGCIGAAIARELSKYKGSILWLEAADDVSQGATKGNSGIVHAGYDDTPGSVRAKHCWKGNQMFASLDKELRFGYQTNGSLVLALDETQVATLHDLMKRGEKNGVQNLRIVEQKELLEMEPHVNPNAIAALYSPDAGNVIPYEFAIALAENAVDNGVELHIRSIVKNIEYNETDKFTVLVQHWEPKLYIQAISANTSTNIQLVLLVVSMAILGHYTLMRMGQLERVRGPYYIIGLVLVYAANRNFVKKTEISKTTKLETILQKFPKSPQGTGGNPVQVKDMLVGGSGSQQVHKGQIVGISKIRADYIINCAGGNSDTIANMIGDTSFKIKPRLGDYLLLNRNQGYLARHTLFPCPDPKLGKGVLVQTTLWGNLILGPTARDAPYDDMNNKSVQEYILQKCKQLVPSFDAKETFHAFCGARAKSDRGDWIIEASKANSKFLNVAGIDSPGLAGAPSIAQTVVKLLNQAGLELQKDSTFEPNRAPIILPKDGMKGLKMGPIGKFDSDGSNTDQMKQNVICKCEKVTEYEVVTALRRSLPIDSSQAIRKRTRAGMGHCQGDADNYDCEGRVRAIVARETGTPVAQIGSRPWPATSTLPHRWLDEKDKEELEQRSK